MSLLNSHKSEKSSFYFKSHTNHFNIFENWVCAANLHLSSTCKLYANVFFCEIMMFWLFCVCLLILNTKEWWICFYHFFFCKFASLLSDIVATKLWLWAETWTTLKIKLHQNQILKKVFCRKPLDKPEMFHFVHSHVQPEYLIFLFFKKKLRNNNLNK